jgi:NADH dehydrogenase
VAPSEEEPIEDSGLDVVTGALSYTGRHIATQLLDAGRRVRTLTGHPDRDPEFAVRLEIEPYRFDDPAALARSLEGATTLYNTYWVRFNHRGVHLDDAVTNSKRLFTAAREAGIERIVHVSVTKPSLSSPITYWRNKARVESLLAAADVPFSIVRPSVLFGSGDILINNVAWLLRRLPLFAIAGDGSYRVRPVHVDDVGRLCVESAVAPSGTIIDAVGPETYTFEELVVNIGEAIGHPRRLVHLPTAAVRVLAGGLSLTLRDRLLTKDELAELMGELVYADGPTTGDTSFRGWLADHGDTLGRHYASELDRHFDEPTSVDTDVHEAA